RSSRPRHVDHHLTAHHRGAVAGPAARTDAGPREQPRALDACASHGCSRRVAAGDGLRSRREAAALAQTSTRASLLRVRREADSHPGARPVPSVPGGRALSRETNQTGKTVALPLVLAPSAIRAPGRADPVPVPARVLPLVPA